MIEQLCPWDAPTFLFFSSNIPTLFFYSHIPSMLVALILGSIVYFRDKSSKVARSLFIIVLLFFAWSFSDLILWATNDPSSVMFFWTLQIVIEPLIFIASLLLTYRFVFGKEPSFLSKLVVSLSIMPLVIFLSSDLNLIGVNLTDCTAIEGFFAHYYSYIFELIYIVLILIISIKGRLQTKDSQKIKEIGYFGLGIILFLLAFSWGNIFGSFSSNWTVAQAGLIGMPIFVAFLSYLIVRFKSFNIKLIGAQALIYALAALVVSIAFIRRIENARMIAIFTLVFVIILGNILVKSVKREIEQRQRLEQLRLKLEQANLNLEVANDKLKDLDKLKTEFLSLAAHQLRSPLTAIKGYTSMLIDGDFGVIGTKQKDAVNRVFESSVHLSKVVEDLLNVSKIEAGGMKYEMAPFDIEKATGDLARDLSITAEKKGLKLAFKTDKKAPYTVNGDMEKIRQVVLNVIDNAIKYTEKGGITIMLSKDSGMIKVAVTDTGIGISPEEKEKLFQKFSRGAGGKTNTGGSGLGLYLAKTISEAHGGHIAIDSPGVGLGSTFTIELKAS
jgi:signal transduction histidine kinase